jgi:hypothetical protein
VTGERVIPPTKLSHFSYENYGDRDILTAGGTVKKEKRASGFLPSVEQLTKKQWTAIIAAAREFAFKDQSDESTAVIGGANTDGDESDGFLLQQSDSDKETEVGDGGDDDELESDRDAEGDLEGASDVEGAGNVEGAGDLEGDDDVEGAGEACTSRQTTRGEPSGVVSTNQELDPDAEDGQY